MLKYDEIFQIQIFLNQVAADWLKLTKVVDFLRCFGQLKISKIAKDRTENNVPLNGSGNSGWLVIKEILTDIIRYLYKSWTYLGYYIISLKRDIMTSC